MVAFLVVQIFIYANDSFSCPNPSPGLFHSGFFSKGEILRDGSGDSRIRTAEEKTGNYETMSMF